MKEQRTYLVDIDGTVADCSHRLHWIENKPKRWDKFKDPAEILKDEPIHPVIDVIADLSRHSNMIFFTAREGSESTISATLGWLNIHYHGDYDDIFFRPENDYRSDEIVKKEMYQKLLEKWQIQKVTAVFDDRPRVVKMWRDMGLFVFDVNTRGDF